MPTRRTTRKFPFAFFDTAVGKCALAWSKGGIVAVQLPERTQSETVRRLGKRWSCEVLFEEAVPPREVRRIMDVLIKHLAGESADLTTITVDFDGVPPFHRKVYQAARKIPSGQIRSYGQVAAAAGSPQAARAVGQAMARNPYPLIVPCHRVMGSDGSAVGFSAYGGCDLKKVLLEAEGYGSETDSDVSSRRERRFGQAKTQPPRDDANSALKYTPKEAIAHLSRVDKQLGRVIDQVGVFGLELDEMLTPFETLAESIVYQQLTGKAAATIFARVKAIYGGSRLPEPIKIVNTSDQQLRAAGLSTAKTLALKDLALKQHEGLIPSLAVLEQMDDEEIISCLTAVRGVGRWTVEMLLLFRLGRSDVLPVSDYGVRKGFMRTYKLKQLPTAKQIAEHAEKWRPYRSVASWYMWRANEL